MKFPAGAFYSHFFKIGIGLYTNHNFSQFMARFERSEGRSNSSNGGTFEDFMKGKGRRGSSRGSSRDSGRSFNRGSSRDSGRRGSSRDSDRGDSRRGPKRFGNKRRDLEMTKVICSECGIECEVPFKPMTDKPVFCSECFEKKEGGSSRSSSRSSGSSNLDLEKINKKLDKIMQALKIE